MLDFTPFTRWFSGIAFLVMMIGIFPVMERFTKSHVGDKLPDTTLRYTTKDLYSWAEEYGERGRTWYIILRFSYDLIFPMTYGAFLFIFIGHFLNQINEQMFFIAYLPLIGMTLDYIENIIVSIIMFRFPLKTPVVDRIVPTISFIKRVTVLFSFLLLAVVGVLSIIL